MLESVCRSELTLSGANSNLIRPHNTMENGTVKKSTCNSWSLKQTNNNPFCSICLTFLLPMLYNTVNNERGERILLNKSSANISCHLMSCQWQNLKERRKWEMVGHDRWQSSKHNSNKAGWLYLLFRLTGKHQIQGWGKCSSHSLNFSFWW